MRRYGSGLTCRGICRNVCSKTWSVTTLFCGGASPFTCMTGIRGRPIRRGRPPSPKGCRASSNLPDVARFFDLPIAAPSMKAALEAWGSNLNLFHKGLAREVDDPDIVAATLAKPGVVLQRPVRAATRTRLNLRIGPPRRFTFIHNKARRRWRAPGLAAGLSA